MLQFGVPENSNDTLPLSSRVYQMLVNRFGANLKLALYLTVISFFLLHVLVASIMEDRYEDVLHPSHYNSTSTTSTTPDPNPSNSSTSSHSKHNLQETTSSVMLSLVIACLIWMLLLQFVRCIRVRRLSAMSNPMAQQEQLMLTQFLQLSRSRNQPLAVMAQRMRLMLLNRDFTGDDYEILQQLDDARFGGTPPSRGASDELINSLPLERIDAHSTASVDDASQAEEGRFGQCNICLAPYEEGDQVRILPCVHRFHQSCVDQWLQSNAVCPVCKLSLQPT